MITRIAAVFLVGTIAAAPAMANEYEGAMRDFVTSNVLPWVNDATLIDAIKTQNAAHAGLSATQIDEMDQTWRAQVGTPIAPLVDDVLNNPASSILVEKLEAAGGTISELFVTDNIGLNVAASGATSDYWQGDEAKFTEVFGKGTDAMHFGDIEFDESAQTYMGQVSVPLVDSASGNVIGTMTIGLDAEALLS